MESRDVHFWYSYYIAKEQLKEQFIGHSDEHRPRECPSYLWFRGTFGNSVLQWEHYCEIGPAPQIPEKRRGLCLLYKFPAITTHEADNSCPSCDEVMYPPYVFIAWYLVNHRDNFTFRR
jgi:hypothetical protein